MAGYIKISELPEKESIQTTDYIIAEDLQDTWKIKAEHLTDHISGQISEITESLNQVMEDAQNQLQDISNTQKELEDTVKSFEDAENQRQENEEQRIKDFQEMKDNIDELLGLDLDGQLSDLLNQMANIQAAENQRQQNEIQRGLNEAARQEKAGQLDDLIIEASDLNNTLETAETERQQNEAQRITNENDRIELYNELSGLADELRQAEAERVQAEEDRETNTTTIINNMQDLYDQVQESEAERIQAEDDREAYMSTVREFISQVETTEAGRVSAETIRVTEFNEMKNFIESIQTENGFMIMDSGTSSIAASSNKYINFASVTINVPEEMPESIPSKYGALFLVNEINSTGTIVNTCVLYVSANIVTNSVENLQNVRFSTISLSITDDSTCDPENVWVVPRADYGILYIGYTAQPSNSIEYKLITDSASQFNGILDLYSTVYTLSTCSTSYPSSIAPITAGTSPVNSKTAGYEKYLFDVFNKSSSSSAITAVYPIGTEYTTTQDINPSASFGGTWEKVGNGGEKTVYSTLDDDGSVTDTVVHTVYKWVRTA